MPTQAEKCHAFAALHAQPEAFIIPNPWDVGSARIMQGVGFKALATTSGGFAYTLGKGDGEPTLEEKLAHCAAIAGGTDIPVSVDFEDGFGADPAAVARSVEALIATGVAGCSIEDFDRAGQTLYELPLALERLRAAIEVARGLDFPFTITARAEHLLRAGRDLDEVINRLQAFETAGADVLYAPGIASLDDLKTVTDALNRPFNVLGVYMPEATLSDFAAAGAQRVSIGGALTYASVKPIIEFSEQMLEEGTFNWTAQMASRKRIAELLASGRD